LIHVIYATDKDIGSKPNDLHNFLKGWFETIAYMRSHQAETVRIVDPIGNAQ
jgi:ABC-type nitrate/sulfonate/bicarbonate transport system substrate-binding protein